MRAREGGTWRTLRRGRTRTGGQWRNLTRAVAYQGGAWRNAANFVEPPTLAITGTPFGIINGSGTVVTGIVTATPSGGLGPYTYAWTRTGGAAASIASPASASTTFNLFLNAPDSQSATFQCVVTDALGSTASASVTATFNAITFD